MKRVLQIAASLGIGGAEKVERDIGLSLDPKEYEIHYIVFGNKIGAYELELLKHGCKVFHWPSPSESYPNYLHSLRKLMKENHYDIVHAHTMFNIGWAMLAAKQCGVPVRISHAHSALFNGSNMKKTVYEACMRQLILRNATHLVACGNAAGIRLYGKEAYEKQGICILNGIDTDAFSFKTEARERIREKLRIQNDFVIGHVGHLAEVKNQSFLIRLMPKILQKRPNARLLMLGEGEDRPKLESLIRELGLEERVIMTGNVSNVPDYLSAMDVFAFPSLYEGMPLSVIEVQANGLPCVISLGVPEDVYLTDLVHPLPLDQPDDWINAICTSYRGGAERYSNVLRQRGLDIENVLKRICQFAGSAVKHPTFSRWPRFIVIS